MIGHAACAYKQVAFISPTTCRVPLADDVNSTVTATAADDESAGDSSGRQQIYSNGLSNSATATGSAAVAQKRRSS